MLIDSSTNSAHLCVNIQHDTIEDYLLAPQVGGLSVFLFNIRSINNKLNDLKIIIEQISYPDIIIITESWLSPDTEFLFCLPNYKAYFCSRLVKKGGGIIVFVKDLHKSNLIDLVNKEGGDVQALGIKVRPCNFENFLLIATYSPNVNYSSVLVNTLEQLILKHNKDRIILAGDMNVDWLTSSASRNDLAILYSCYNLTICNSLPTRTFKNTSTLIDHIAVNFCDKNIELHGITNDLSDHDILLLNIFLPKDDVNLCDTSTPLNSSSVRLHCDLAKHQLHLSESKDPCVLVQELYDELKPFQIVQSHLVHSIDKKLAPWMNNNLRTLIARKNKIFAIIKKQRKTTYTSSILLREYELLCDNVKRLKTDLQAQYYKDIIKNSSNPWKAINRILGKSDKKTEVITLEVDGKLLREPEQVCEAFNNYFVNIGPSLASNLPAETAQPRTPKVNYCVGSLFLAPATEPEILAATMSLKPSSSAGLDGISNNCLKKFAEKFAPPLTQIINASMSSGIVPDVFKRTRTIPIHKSKSKTDINNYRPISLVSSFSKLLERIVKSRLMSFLVSSNFFYTHQYGFLPKSGTANAVFDTVVKIQEAIDCGKRAAVTFIDLRKAFDTVDHDILIEKLSCAGARGIVSDWFTSYLTDREQSVSYGNAASSFRKILTGVPQGSTLGPILFLIFINDFAELDLKGTLSLFADDANIIYTADSDNQLHSDMQNDLIKIQAWLSENKLSVNVEKTQYVMFNKPSVKALIPPLYMFDSEIKRTNEVKYLGITLDESLSWEGHVSQLANKLASNIGALNRVRGTLDVEHLKTMYFAYIHSNIVYMLPIWGYCKKGLFSKIDRLHKRALKLTLGCLHVDSEILKTNNMFNLSQLLQFQSCILIYQTSKNISKSNTSFTVNSDIHDYPTRNSSKLHPQKIKTSTFGINSVYHRCISSYNALPNELTETLTFPNFKKKLKVWLGQG